jgi:hypothetical protein
MTKYIIHEKSKILNQYIPRISFTTFNQALNYVNNYIEIELHLKNFTISEFKTWIYYNKPLIEESLTGKFEIIF